MQIIKVATVIESDMHLQFERQLSLSAIDYVHGTHNESDTTGKTVKHKILILFFYTLKQQGGHTAPVEGIIASADSEEKPICHSKTN